MKQNHESINWKKNGFLLLGLLLFTIVYWAPAWPDAVDPEGKVFALSVAGKGAIAVFLLAAIIYPLLMAIYAMYGKGDKPTRFGKGLFMGMPTIVD